MPLPVRKSYKGAPATTTLSSGINNSATSFAVAAVTGWPTTFPFYAVIDPGTAKEEKVRVTAIASTTLTVVRAQDDTTAVTHDAAATVYPVFTALEADEANQIASVMTTKGDLISTDGSTINRLAVGATNTHVLQVDSTATNGIKWGQVATAGIADSAITSAKIADGTIVDADVNASAAIALSKLATGALPTAITVASANIVDGTIVAGDVATSLLKLVCPVGTIVPYSGAAAPTGWLLCDGGAVSASYTELRALVGTTTPDLKGRFLYGKTASGTGSTLLGTGGSLTISSANLPTHQHTIDHDHASFNTATGGAHQHGVPFSVALLQNSQDNTAAQPDGAGVDYYNTKSGDGGHAHAIDVPAFTGNSGNGGFANSDYIQPFAAINYIIKHDY